MKTIVKLQKGLLKTNSLRENNSSKSFKAFPLKVFLNNIISGNQDAPIDDNQFQTIQPPDLKNSYGIFVKEDDPELFYFEKFNRNVSVNENYIEANNLNYFLYWPIISNKIFKKENDEIKIINPYGPIEYDGKISSSLYSTLNRKPLLSNGFASSKYLTDNILENIKLSLNNCENLMYDLNKFTSNNNGFAIKRINKKLDSIIKIPFQIDEIGPYSISFNIKTKDILTDLSNSISFSIEDQNQNILEENLLSIKNNWKNINKTFLFKKKGSYNIIFKIFKDNINATSTQPSISHINTLYIDSIQFNKGDIPSAYGDESLSKIQRPLIIYIDDIPPVTFSSLSPQDNSKYSWAISYQRKAPLYYNLTDADSNLDENLLHMECLGNIIKIGYNKGKLFFETPNNTIYLDDPYNKDLIEENANYNWETVNIYPKKKEKKPWVLVVEIIRNKEYSQKLNKKIVQEISLDGVFPKNILNEESFFPISLFHIKYAEMENIPFTFQLGNTFKPALKQFKFYTGYYRDFLYFNNIDSFLKNKKNYLQIERKNQKSKLYAENIEEI